MSDAAALAEIGAGLDQVRAELAALGAQQRAEVAETWRSRAACRSDDLPVFFPVPDGDRVPAEGYAGARLVCAGCEVWAYCLDEGLMDPFGYRGRATPAQRRKLRLARGERRPMARP